ncbi:MULTISPECIES: SDR family NAD(P)-dependent oxidoreductase [Pseudonocardia]|uniref:Cyclopentanol dehydrogenase n=2 Tax=Pseudonocardia TaxID=1847 RepID=A0A1Y2N4F1_PSEAH|nr:MULTISPECIES: SDR family oxidoreductase [Pseudonocardia]OSY42009.1 Cyclopentanol dehydrogenase [Pseudonocardia autotrophica]TDN75222.1 NAD(P)-dependent dehydrogenase (short-subunit alcohol dehydrogenase family) [Pseudonocardia autotrophica]BBF99167.1 cyclopentanol dehydrogenase [Pseudonocardia autotrophica]GEC28580.1 cyclopentanol dehydrogenase [Pseudonocardia saturnea]
MRLQDKIALITGAAAGMGRATALTFAREGATVVLADIEDTGPVAAEIHATGGSAQAVRLDVGDEQAWEEVVAGVLERHRRLDVLVNNAGISGTFDPDITSTVHFDRMMRVNARGTFLGIKHGSAAMSRSGGGAIVNMSSTSASIGQFGMHMGYGATKAAIRSMTRTAAAQTAADGIRVNAVAPGMLPPMQTSRGSADPAWRAAQIDGVPMKRGGEVQEVADVVLFLACAESSYVTGVEILVDGGQTAV